MSSKGLSKAFKGIAKGVTKVVEAIPPIKDDELDLGIDFDPIGLTQVQQEHEESEFN